MRKLIGIVLLIAFFAGFNYAQSGPAEGTIASGWTTNTTNFSSDKPIHGARLKLFNKIPDTIEGKLIETDPSLFTPDHQFTKSRAAARDSVILYKSWGGIPQTSSIPPDPYIAVGPDHVVEVVNTSWRITDKDGNVQATISADSWYSSNGKSYDPFDPKVIYDHYENRWVQVWLHADDANQEAYYLISVSDDADPNGIWYNYALPSDENGNTYSGGWSDYQGVGYDDKAIYITANQFTYGNNASYQYSKLRIVGKSKLYANTAGSVIWNDFWNINHFGIRPSRMDTPSDVFYLVRSIQSGGAFMYVYTVHDPIGTPSLTWNLIAVGAYGSPSNANQLGGNALESGGANIRTEPVYHNGVIHLCHNVRKGSYSGVRYVAIDADTKDVLKDFALSSGQHYYSYPALAVAQNGDVVITYSRSSNTDYVGAYYTVIKPHMNETLGSFLLQEGKANYLKTFGGTRNRWGDYLGAWTDPSDRNNIFIYAEYAAAQNTWHDYVGIVRTVPFDDQTAYVSTNSLDFSNVEVGTDSDPLHVVVKNYGAVDLSITNVANNNADIELLSTVNLPVTLAAFDSLVLEYQYSPSQAEVVNDQVTITSNDPNYPTINVALQGRGYQIDAATDGKLYGFSQQLNDLITINPADAAAEKVGNGLLNEVYGMALNPEDKVLYAFQLNEDEDATNVVRVNASAGDAYVKFQKNLIFTAGTFSTSDTMWVTTNDQKLLLLDLNDESVYLKGNMDKGVNALAFNKADGMLYASISADSADNDKVFSIDPASGIIKEIGSTGIGAPIHALAFNNEGILYASADKSFSRSYLYTVDLTTGEATEVGKLSNFKTVRGLAFVGTVSAVEEVTTELPTDFNISQNYPNPFNPTTTISFALPYKANVNLVVYNSLGEKVQTLVSEVMEAGTYNYKWTVPSNSFSSGVYIYTIKVDGFKGQQIIESGKMMYLK